MGILDIFKRTSKSQDGHSDQPGYYRGRHYTSSLDRVKSLKRQDKLEEADELLGNLIGAVESEAKQQGWTVAPWYYEQLAIVRRKRKDYAGEIAALERYVQMQGKRRPSARAA